MQFFEKKSFFFWSITTFISRFYWKINTAIIILHSTLIIRITFSFIYLRTNKGSPKRRNASREMFIIVVVTLISLLRLLLFTCLFRFNEDITWKRRKNAQTRISIFEKEKFLTTWNVIITARFARFLLHLRFSLSTLVNQQLPRHSRYTPLLVYGDNRPRSRIERTPWKEEAILLRGSDCLPAWSKKRKSAHHRKFYLYRVQWSLTGTSGPRESARSIVGVPPGSDLSVYPPMKFIQVERIIVSTEPWERFFR